LAVPCKVYKNLLTDYINSVTYIALQINATDMYTDTRIVAIPRIEYSRVQTLINESDKPGTEARTRSGDRGDCEMTDAGISDTRQADEPRAFDEKSPSTEQAPPGDLSFGSSDGSNDADAVSSTEPQDSGTSSEGSLTHAPETEGGIASIAIVEKKPDLGTSGNGKNPRGGKRVGAGRRPTLIDLMEFEKLAAMQCTLDEMAGFFNVSVRTIESRVKLSEFAETLARGRARGRISLRRAQMKAAEAGNSAMLTWLGKQYLEQRDVVPIELSGPGGGPVKLSLEEIDAIISKKKES
jgi:hypothetical protein